LFIRMLKREISSNFSRITKTNSPINRVKTVDQIDCMSISACPRPEGFVNP